MEIEFKSNGKIVQYVQSPDELKDFFSGAFIIHSGKTEEEAEALWGFIEDALSENFTIICREDGYYILSREAHGSMPHSTYELSLKDEEEIEVIQELIRKHLGSYVKK